MSIRAQEATVTLLQGGTEVEHTVTIRNPDLVRWDTTRHTHKWPAMEEAPVMWATFVAWAACKRLGLTSAKWEEWRDEECQAVHMPQPDGDEVDPTSREAGPASA